MLLAQGQVRINVFPALIFLTFYRRVVAFLNLVILGLIFKSLRQKVNAKNVHLIVHLVHLQFLAINVLMGSLYKVLTSLNPLWFKYALKFVAMEKDLKQIVMTITQFQEMDAAKNVKLNQDGHVLEGLLLVKILVRL